MNAGRHHDTRSDAAERYGKHSEANARGWPVRELLKHVIRRGEAIRLAWPDGEANASADRSHEFPTAVLPAFQHDGEPEAEGTGPTTATHDARKWFESGGQDRRPASLAGRRASSALPARPRSSAAQSEVPVHAYLRQPE
jgi:hypothetical protein